MSGWQRMAWSPQPGPQSSALLADWADEIFYGGERGGGKSDFQLGYQEDGALRYGSGWRGIVFRKTYPEMEELQQRAMQIFPASGGVFKTQPSADYPYSNSWYWPGGASVKMRYIERSSDYGRYHGHQYTGISFDEVTEYASPDGLLKMLSTLRSPAGVPCGARLTGNPGGVGHIWVKSRYIDATPPYTPYTDPDTGLTRIFIPSRLSDNRELTDNDPGYRSRILAATGGNDALRRAWLEGDWDVVAGAFFSTWDRARHVVRPFTVPVAWTRFRAFDWGSARPFSVGWWAIAQDDHEIGDRLIPRGSLVRYREWYGASAPNVGLKMTAEAVADGIISRDGADRIAYSVADPSCWRVDGGPSIAERMFVRGVRFRPADNSRIAGWDQVRARLEGVDGRPTIYVFDSCTDSIRTLPLMQHDDSRIEDIDTDMEDHAADEWRYACMSRPFVRAVAVPVKPKFALDLTFNEMVEQSRRKRIGED